MRPASEELIFYAALTPRQLLVVGPAKIRVSIGKVDARHATDEIMRCDGCVALRQYFDLIKNALRVED